MKVEVFILDNSRCACDNKDCKRSPEYHVNLIGHVWKMKSGFPCLWITLGKDTELYCYECIDAVYAKIKIAFDKKLWILK